MIRIDGQARSEATQRKYASHSQQEHGARDRRAESCSPARFSIQLALERSARVTGPSTQTPQEDCVCAWLFLASAQDMSRGAYTKYSTGVLGPKTCSQHRS